MHSLDCARMCSMSPSVLKNDSDDLAISRTSCTSTTSRYLDNLSCTTVSSAKAPSSLSRTAVFSITCLNTRGSSRRKSLRRNTSGTCAMSSSSNPPTGDTGDIGWSWSRRSVAAVNGLWLCSKRRYSARRSSATSSSSAATLRVSFSKCIGGISVVDGARKLVTTVAPPLMETDVLGARLRLSRAWSSATVNS